MYCKFFLLITDGKDCNLTDINMFLTPTEPPNESLFDGMNQPVGV